MKKNLMPKKSQSQVVSTVLLILVTIAAIGIIISFTLPFIKNQLKKGDCFKVQGQVQIEPNPKYTCYDEGEFELRVQIHIGENESIKGFYIEPKGVSSKSYKITNDLSDAAVVNYFIPGGGIQNPKPIIPSKNSAKTYVITGITSMPDSIAVYPILNEGQSCEASDILESIDNCPSTG